MFDYNGDGTLTKQDFISYVNTHYAALTAFAPKAIQQPGAPAIDTTSPDYFEDITTTDYPVESEIQQIPADQFSTDDKVILIGGAVVVFLLIVTLFLININRR